MNTAFQVVAALSGRDIPAVAVLVERCVCCWSAAHPDQVYPASWSSTLCKEHADWTRARRLKAGRHAK